MTQRAQNSRRPGRPGRVTEATAKQIVAAVGLPLCDGVEVPALTAALNHVTTETAIRAHELPPRARIETLSKFKKSFEAVEKQLKRTLPKHELYPPPPTDEWVDQIREWVASAEEELAAEAASHRGRPTALPSHFFDLSLGLYHAAFGKKPAYTLNDSNQKIGPTGRFVSAFVRAAINSSEELMVYNEYFQSQGSRDDWSILGDDALSSTLKRAITKPSRDRSAEAKVAADHKYEWQVYSNFFRTAFLRRR
ncbi:hypothetical protein GQ651_09205 [Alphaproteobacteria bacterium GH1-50]|uniref:Uncharacterized protein n=1 Tax=Kangsaoukella pontilimi TaxID=2691042 RepID=A0A7C9J396_9RHOB|nr:hypothetical protein [Kangsaoukella pontilimi]MXQ08021.1 hypothetical protein [Kangsaoukella pontilimi]